MKESIFVRHPPFNDTINHSRGEEEKPMMRRLVLCRRKEIELETISEVYFQPEAIKSVKKKKKLLREEMHVQYVQLIRLAG